MKKIKGILIVMMLVFVLYGCEEGSDQPTTETFMGGTRAIDARFEQMGTFQDNVEYVWVGESFPVDVTINNVGEQEIPENELEVTIYGVDTDLYNIDYPNMHNPNIIMPKTEFNQLGGMETISFGTAMLEEVTGSFVDANFNARIEYPYKTYIAVPNVCFKENIRDTSLCEVQGNKQFSFSGAPIIVSKVSQEPYGADRVALTFEVENRGSGRAKAEGEEFSELRDTVNFELVEGPTNIEMSCSSMGNENFARLNNGRGTINCRSEPLPEDTLFENQVTLELSYTYRENIQKTLKIRNEPN